MKQSRRTMKEMYHKPSRLSHIEQKVGRKDHLKKLGSKLEMTRIKNWQRSKKNMT